MTGKILALIVLVFLLFSIKQVTAQYGGPNQPPGGGGCINCPGKPKVTVTPSCDSTTKTPVMSLSWTPFPDANTSSYEIWRTDNTERTQADGLFGYYYNNSNLSGTHTFKRKDRTINFDWGNGSPDPRINSDSFSVRWTGQVLIPADGDYIFYVSIEAEDGVRFYFNNKLVIDKWQLIKKANEFSYKATKLTANTKYNIGIEYYDETGPSQIKLSWESKGITKQIIPQSQLFSNPLNFTELATQTINTYRDSSDLIAGTEYSYLIVANGPNGTSSSLTLPEAATNCSAPIVTSPSLYLSCYTPATWVAQPPQPISVVATDESGVASVNLLLTELGGQSTSFSATNTPSGSSNWQYNFNPPPPQLVLGRNYRLEATATDSDSPPNTSTPYLLGEFSYSNSCLLPWIRTFGGDVHSNGTINTPGGP